MAFHIGLVAIVIVLLLVLIWSAKSASRRRTETKRQRGIARHPQVVSAREQVDAAGKHAAIIWRYANASPPKGDRRHPEIHKAAQELRAAEGEVEKNQVRVTQAQDQLTDALRQRDDARMHLRATVETVGETARSAGPGSSGKRAPG